jgi:hypothetical protein
MIPALLWPPTQCYGISSFSGQGQLGMHWDFILDCPRQGMFPKNPRYAVRISEPPGCKFLTSQVQIHPSFLGNTPHLELLPHLTF